MVLIPLKSQFVSLIFSFVSLFAEIALLNAAISINKYLECNALRKGHRVKVRYHQRRVSLFTIVALLGFLALEIFASFLSNPADRKISVSQRCISVDAIIRRPEPAGRVLQDDIIGFKCIDFRDDLVVLKAGNYSFEEKRVICGTTVLEYDPTNIPLEYPLDNAQGPSQENPNPDPLLRCSQGDCVVVQTVQTDENSTLISVSNLLKADMLEQFPEVREEVPILITKVFYDTSGLLSEFAGRAIDTFRRGARDPIEINRRIYMGSEETMCPFDRDLGEGTTIPLPLIYIISVVWSVSFLVCFASFLLRRSSFYDISDPVHWAKRTRHTDDEQIEGDPVVSSVFEEGRQVVYVSDSPPTNRRLFGRS